MTDWRALCAELVEQLERYQSDFPARTDKMAYRAMAADDVLARARAVLAEPVGEGVTDQELLELMPEQFREDLATVSRMAAYGAGTGVTPGLFRVSLNTGALAFARAVLVRWGHQPAPPAEGEAIGPEWQPCVKLPITVHVREQRSGETQVSTREGITPVRPDDLIMRGVQGEEYPIGRELFNKTYRLGTAGHQPAPPVEGEVAELVQRLRYAKQNGNSIPSRIHWGLGDGTEHHGSIYVGSNHAADCARAADLLEQRHPTPVPVSKRLPGPGDCDAEGRFWAWCKATKEWCLLNRWHYREESERNAPGWASGWPYWLPATALPLPAGEVEP